MCFDIDVVFRYAQQFSNHIRLEAYQPIAQEFLLFSLIGDTQICFQIYNDVIKIRIKSAF